MRNFLVMPVVKRMRNEKSDPTANLTYPPEYEAKKEQVDIIKNLQYPSAYHNNKYDLYLPKNSAEKCPAIIWVHGGSFVAGTKDGVVNVAVMFAAEGFAVAAMDYALAPEAKHPVPALQAQELYTHLSAEGYPYFQVDAKNIFIAGDSAGALIAAQFAAIETNPSLAKAVGTKSVVPKGALKGAVLICGPYDIPGIRKADNKPLRFAVGILGKAMFGGRPWYESEGCRQSVICAHVTENYPPVYITDGNTGSFEAQGRRLGEALREKGVPVHERYFEKEEGEVPHEYLFSLADGSARICLRDIIDFLLRYKSD